jgi:transcriptional regulator with XRE-family HTH domain
VDTLRIGRSLLALRIRRGWRQADAAAAARLSRSQYARIERGDLRGVPIEDIEAACVALGADVDVRVRWHGEGLDRLLDAAHAELVNQVVRLLAGSGWECAVEVSFNHFGERGSVDVLAWHPATSTLLVVEVKSVVPDVQAMISAHDRKLRLAAVVGRPLGWTPQLVGRLLVVAESATSRGRVRDFKDLFGAAYPQRAIDVRRWLHAPTGPLSGLLFVRNSSPDGVIKRAAGRQRVRRRKVADPGI